MVANEDGFKDRLRQAATNAALTQTILASLVGVSQKTVSQWMLGRERPTTQQQADLARHLGVRVEWLTLGTLPTKEPSSLGAAIVTSSPVAAQTPVDGVQPEALGTGDSLDEHNIGWDFRPAPKDGGKDFGNSNVWSLKPGLDVLVREVLQNAKDAAVSPEQRVDVVFRIITLRGDDLTRFRRALRWDSDLAAHLGAASQGDQRFNTLLRDGILRVKDELRLLIIEESGTVGLTGPERDKGNFMALCRNNLDSHKGGGAGGAFGLGKAVLWRASRLFTVLFGSTLSVPEPATSRSENRLFGRCDLAWHTASDKSFAGPGWFGIRGEDGTTESIWEQRELSDELFVGRDSVGTTTCVVGFHDASDDLDAEPTELAKTIASEAAKNFFPALVAQQLSVQVEVYASGSQWRKRVPSFSQTVVPESFMPASVTMLRAFLGGKTVTELTDEAGAVAMRQVELVVPKRAPPQKDQEITHQAVLLVTAADEDTASPDERPSHLAMFRGPGMVVQRRSLAGLCLGARPFHALLLCGRAAVGPSLPAEIASGEAAEEFLRRAEPPSHDQWTSTPDLAAYYARGCRAKLEGFLKRAVDNVRELVKPSALDTGDGPNALKDLFRIGTEPASFSEQPSVVCSGQPDGEGRWVVRARVKMKAKKTAQRVTAAVDFLTENGGGVPVKWATLEAEAGCEVVGFDLIVPPGTREIRFTGTTDPSSHPVPAGHSCVTVDIKKVVQIFGGAS